MHLRVHLPSARHRGPITRLVSELAHTPSELTVLAGTWLIVAPLVLDHETAGMPFIGWNDVVTGLAIVAVAFLRVFRPEGTAPLNGVALLLGAWLTVAPFVRGYSSAPLATANDVFIGVVVMVLAVAGWRAARSGNDGPHPG